VEWLTEQDRELARRVLARAAARRESPADAAAIADDVFRQLHESLMQWFGGEAVDALIARAVDRVRSVDPVLQGMSTSSTGATRLDGAARLLRAATPADAQEALITLVGTFIALLGRLVGRDLAMRLIEQGRLGEDQPNEQRYAP
jgi:hypothetical protein